MVILTVKVAFSLSVGMRLKFAILFAANDFGMPEMIKRSVNIFFNALTFYTRLPAPKWVNYSTEYLNRGSAYFPLVGILVAVLCFGVFQLAHLIFSVELSLLISMAASLLITGAFHEDGFADLCDGFGGGWQQADILRIMKDSRLGTYGVSGLFFILALKWASLSTLKVEDLLISLILAHSLSRAWSISLITVLPYVQADSQSKAKPIAQAWHKNDLILAWCWALTPLIFIPLSSACLLLATGFFAMVMIRQWFQRRLQGYTGDALGASQQIQEVLVYWVLIASLN